MRKWWSAFRQWKADRDLQYHYYDWHGEVIHGRLGWWQALAHDSWWMFKVWYCEKRGHDYHPDGRDFPESGGEGFSCRRCGHSFMAWH